MALLMAASLLLRNPVLTQLSRNSKAMVNDVIRIRLASLPSPRDLQFFALK